MNSKKLITSFRNCNSGDEWYHTSDPIEINYKFPTERQTESRTVYCIILCTSIERTEMDKKIVKTVASANNS